MTSQSGWDKYLTGALIVLVVWFMRTMMDDDTVVPAMPTALAVQPDTDA